MARRLVLASALVLAGSAFVGPARAQDIEPREREAARRYVVVTALPTFAPPPRRFAADDPQLLVHALGLDLRSLWLSPRLELSFAQGTKLVALDIIGWGNVTFTPTSFGGGTLTLTAPF